MKKTLLTLGTIACAYGAWKFTRPLPDPGQPISDSQDQTTNVFDDVTIAAQQAIDSVTQGQTQVDDNMAQQNRTAFLNMIAYSEGTAGPNGYRTMFGGRLFDSFDDHPRQVFSFTNSKGQTLTTTAAGRYQFLAKTWDSLAAKLGLTDFSPASQDAGALELIRERGALDDVDAGRVDSAIQKCAPIWASFPGAGYAQPERKIASLEAAFTDSGGIIT